MLQHGRKAGRSAKGKTFEGRPCRTCGNTERAADGATARGSDLWSVSD